MKAVTIVAATLAVAALAAAPTLAQQQAPKPDAKASGECAQKNARTPQKIEGEVTGVDPNSGMITVRGSDGTTHQFKASKDTLSEYKIGDKLEANLRQPAPCA